MTSRPVIAYNGDYILVVSKCLTLLGTKVTIEPSPI